MRIGERRIPFETLRRIETFTYFLFVAVAAVAVGCGITQNHTMFYVTAVVALLYLPAMYFWVTKHIAYKYSILMHGIVLLMIASLFIIGFERYAVGIAALTCSGLLFSVHLIMIAVGDGSLRFRIRAHNGNEENPDRMMEMVERI